MIPKQVQTAAWIVMGATLVGVVELSAQYLYETIHEHGWTLASQGALLLGGLLIFAVLDLPMLLVGWLVFAKLRARRNWARVVLAVIAVLMVCELFYYVPKMIGAHDWSIARRTAGVAWQLVFPSLFACATALVYSRDSNAWFRGEQSEDLADGTFSS